MKITVITGKAGKIIGTFRPAREREAGGRLRRPDRRTRPGGSRDRSAEGAGERRDRRRPASRTQGPCRREEEIVGGEMRRIPWRPIGAMLIGRLRCLLPRSTPMRAACPLMNLFSDGYPVQLLVE